METFVSNFGTTLILGGIFVTILIVACIIAEKCGLGDKLANMFADKDNKE